MHLHFYRKSFLFPDSVGKAGVHTPELQICQPQLIILVPQLFKRAIQLGHVLNGEFGNIFVA